MRAADSCGAWSYRPGASPAAEPTALTLMALAAQGIEMQHHRNALDWLASQQRADGAVPVCLNLSSPCWTTGLAILAWSTVDPQGPNSYASAIERAATWLITTKGRQIPNRPDVYGHDTSLRGWPWVEGTHSWVEPTAYGVLGLRAAQQSGHPRCREGVRLLLDRAFPGGGWNYGNTKILGSPLRPFPAPTGIALTALAGDEMGAPIAAGIEYLTAELPSIRAPLTLSWGLIGLSAWHARPDDAPQWLAESATNVTPYRQNLMLDALLLLADGDPAPWVQRSEGHAHART